MVKIPETVEVCDRYGGSYKETEGADDGWFELLFIDEKWMENRVQIDDFLS